MALDSLQKLFVHEQMAAYGCLRAHAGVLGHDEAARLRGQTLKEEETADAKPTQLAEGGINENAAAAGPGESEDN